MKTHNGNRTVRRLRQLVDEFGYLSMHNSRDGQDWFDNALSDLGCKVQDHQKSNPKTFTFSLIPETTEN